MSYKKKQNNHFVQLAYDGAFSAVMNLISKGQDIDASGYVEGGISITALSVAAARGHTELAMALITAGARVDHRDSCGEYPMTYAARNGNVDLIKRLAMAGADIEVCGEKGRPLEWAIGKCKYAAAAVLVELGATPVIRDGRGVLQPLVMHAIEKNDEYVFAALKNKGRLLDPDVPDVERTALALAVAYGRYGMAMDLLVAGAKPNVPDMLTGQPLLLAVLKARKLGLAEMMIQKDRTLVSMMDDAGRAAATILDDLRQERLDREAAEKKASEEKEEARKREAERQENGCWEKTASHAVTLTRFDKGVGRVLKDTFNFRVRERVSAFVDAQGKVEAMTITGFDDMKDKTLLEEALDEFQRQGGNADRSVLRGPVLQRRMLRLDGKGG